eukprot:3957726-Amphidinium_carterae.2
MSCETAHLCSGHTAEALHELHDCLVDQILQRLCQTGACCSTVYVQLNASSIVARVVEAVIVDLHVRVLDKKGRLKGWENLAQHIRALSFLH